MYYYAFDQPSDREIVGLLLAENCCSSVLDLQLPEVVLQAS